MIEISAIVLVANVIFGLIPKTWQAGAVTSGIMIIVSYIAWGVAPRTLGRQHGAFHVRRGGHHGGQEGLLEHHQW